tara:strand:+ start:161 stop:313 length:153 start_codon:yes stop_codon:yes gene_type:complete
LGSTSSITFKLAGISQVARNTAPPTIIAITTKKTIREIFFILILEATIAL